MAFPTTSVLDDFNRAGPGLGANWTVPSLVSGFNISSNVIFGAASGNVIYWNPSTHVDSEAFAGVPNLPGSGQGCGVGLGGQNVSSITTFDAYQVWYVHGAPGTIAIQRVDNGAPTTLVSTAQTLSAGDQIGIRRVGSNLYAYVNGTQVLTTSDATYTGAGVVYVDSDNTSSSFDNFGGGTYVDPNPKTIRADYSQFPRRPIRLDRDGRP